MEMLNFNSSLGSPNVQCWKILILDSVGQKVLSPVVRVNDLREQGVTLYLQLHSDRQVIPDVPAIYFIQPTADNIERVAQDMAAGLYDSYYLNFTSTISRDLLEELAQRSLHSGTSAFVAKVVDQHLSYICLESNLFSLEISDVYYKLNQSDEASIEALMEQMAESLFGMLLTFGGQPPLMLCSKGTAAEGVGLKLNQRLRDRLAGTKNASPNAIDSLQRPLMLLLDRSFDLGSMLRHSSTYNALVHDVLGMQLNRLSLAEGKSFVLDGHDWFWAQNATLPFPSVAENVDSALSSYKTDFQQVTRSTGDKDLQQVEKDLQ